MAVIAHTSDVAADGQVIVRSGPMARRMRVLDPFAGWFASDEGRLMAKRARRVDSVHEVFNLTRYKYTTTLLRTKSEYYDQILILGSGYDCRPLWLHEFHADRVRVFEVDRAETLARKQAVLKNHKIRQPDWLTMIESDLRRDDLPRLLQLAGYDQDQPTLVLIEGLLYYFPKECSQKLTGPHWLNLRRGSTLVFDVWRNLRIRVMNQRLKQLTGQRLFHQIIGCDDAATYERQLLGQGLRQVKSTSLDSLFRGYTGEDPTIEFPESWMVMEALV